VDNSDFRAVLSKPVDLDPFLADVAHRMDTHRFLGGATQGCYLRQVALISDYMESIGRRPENVTVLDWGTGKGHITYLLAAQGFRVTSCDVESQAVDSTFGQQTPIVAECKFPIVPLKHDWLLPFPDASFDVVVSFGVLEHVPNDSASLAEIRRILKPDGVFFFLFLT
jgi:2-polyprenyl-3-methyl-5-hydroxy-6-metoxy-1,4-benzoquinol methylase